jgi:hypothetical protein
MKSTHRKGAKNAKLMSIHIYLMCCLDGAYLSGSPLDARWMGHAVCAVIHRMCRKALNKKDVVLLRNARWVM